MGLMDVFTRSKNPPTESIPSVYENRDAVYVEWANEVDKKTSQGKPISDELKRSILSKFPEDRGWKRFLGIKLQQLERCVGADCADSSCDNPGGIDDAEQRYNTYRMEKFKQIRARLKILQELHEKGDIEKPLCMFACPQ